MPRSFRPCRRAPVLAVAVVAMLAATTPTAAQTVVGRVTDAATGQALAGVFVMLEDTAGERVVAVLTNPAGNFAVRGAAPGRYRLAAELIGYGTRRTAWLELEPAASVRRDLEMAVEAVSLDGIAVSTGTRCRPRPGSGPETARLWEEARKALEVARWGQTEGALRFFIAEHKRTLEAASLRVAAQETAAKSSYYAGSPYVSIPIDRLHDGGYVQLAEDGEYDYYAPDPEVLLSDGFLDTHCFAVVPGPRSELELIGLAFEPIAERELPDVRGVLWLEREGAALRRVDFTYTRLPFDHGRWDQVGGRVEFERLPTGMWIVSRWRIRMPLAASRRGGFGGSASELELLSLTEEGAEVRRVYTRSGELVSATGDHVLHGVVLGGPGPHGRGLADARVEVVGTGRTAITDRQGTFAIEGLPPGRYTVRVTHFSELDRIGIGPLEREVELSGPTRVVIGANLSAARARELCEAAGWGGAPKTDPVVLYGTVRGGDTDEPVGGALVRLRTPAGERRTLADSAGVFRLCVEAGPSAAELAAVEPRHVGVPHSELDPITPALSEPGFVSADLTLSGVSDDLAGRPGVGVSRAAGSDWRNALLGRVFAEETRSPVEGAMVTLVDSAGAAVSTRATDSRGNFRFDHPGTGEAFTLRVEHIAYTTVEAAVDFDPEDQLRLDVALAPDVIPLDPIIVTERRRGFLADQGFYRRLEHGLGTFVQREEIERRRPSRITDLLHGRAGFQVVTGDFEADVRLLSQTSLRTGRMACQPSIWLDGALVRAGGGTTGNDIMLSEVISPEEVEALEVYTRASAMPIQYGGDTSPCGAVVIWSRRG